MYRIRKKFSFSAAHQLNDLPEGHPCGNLHGHNYEVEVVLEGSPNKVGFIRDYRELDAFKKFLDEKVDHRNLNDVFSPMQTTAENLAWMFFAWCKEEWPDTSAVLVSETPKTWAEYSIDVRR